MSRYLVIRLGSTADLTLKFQLRETPLAELWLDRMNRRHNWPLDHRDRFYNFGTVEHNIQQAAEYIQRCIQVINDFEPIIEREFEYTQDHFNYLHHIFEVYHGLLDQQTHPLWQRAPESVRKALAELNIAVHRCESAQRYRGPRFVCTWFGMPKDKQLDPKLQQLYGESRITWGTVYLNYCEIGKTMEDLVTDNDKYIGDDAFKPFNYYSADFNVQFNDNDLINLYPKILRYIDQHQEFFLARGIDSVYNVQAQPLRFPVADLVYSGDRQQLIDQIAQQQWISDIFLE